MARLAVGLVPLLAAASLGVAASSEGGPSFVVILVDDLGWMDLGVYGSTFYESPRLDRFARTGVRFTDAYSASPVCSPTRASIMTGKDPARLGITDWIPGDRPRDRPLLGPEIRNELPLEEETLAEVLRTAGYRTFFAGKWHLGGEGYWPDRRGFDVNKGGHDRGSPPGGYYSPYQNPALEDGPEGEYLPDRLTDESIAFLQANRDRRFLLFLSFYTVHTPIQPCERHIARFEAKAAALPEPATAAQIPEGEGFTKTRQDNAAYASMIYAMDENVGRLLDALDRLALSDGTVVIFTSDNGGRATLRGRPGDPTANLPLRAGKGWAYEGGVRVPLIIRVPGLTRPGTLTDVPVISTDLFPTILELAGVEPRHATSLDGVSLLPVLRSGSELDREAIHWHYPHYHGSGWTPGGAIRAGDWKLVEFFEDNRVELYNLGDDIGEVDDLAAIYPERTAELLRRLRAWRVEVGARMPRPNPDFEPGRTTSDRVLHPRARRVASRSG